MDLEWLLLLLCYDALRMNRCAGGRGVHYLPKIKWMLEMLERSLAAGFLHRLVTVRSMRCRLHLGRSRISSRYATPLVILIRTAGYEPRFRSVSVYGTVFSRCQ